MLFVQNIRFVDKVIKVAPFFWKTIYDFNLQLLSDDTIKVFWKNESNLKQNIWWFCCQKQVFQARITNHTPQFTVGCKLLIATWDTWFWQQSRHMFCSKMYVLGYYYWGGHIILFRNRFMASTLVSSDPQKSTGILSFDTTSDSLYSTVTKRSVRHS